MLRDALWYAILAGVLGTGLGGLLGVCFPRNSRVLTGRMFRLSAGLMLAVVFFDLVPEALELAAVWVVCAGVALGALFVFFVSERVHHTMERRVGKKGDASMLTTAVVLLLSVILHNLPEGLVLGSSALIQHGLSTTLLITAHNLPEGMAMALPFVEGGQSRPRAVLLCLLAGAPTVVGAAIGYFLGGVSPLLIALCLSIAAGAMLCTIFSEMTPQACRLSGEEDPAGLALTILGTLIGLLIVSAA